MGIAIMAAALTFLFGAPASDDKAAKPAFVVHSGYFESNKSGLKGESSFLAFTNNKAYDNIFRSVFIPGKKPNLLPKGVFDKNLVVAVVKRGTSIYEYKVEKVEEKKGVLTITYKATGKDGGGSATFASPER